MMKNLIGSLLLSCLAAASAIGADADEMLRDRLIFCSQFVIEDPAPAEAWDIPRHCCRHSQRAHDCHVHDWGGQFR